MANNNPEIKLFTVQELRGWLIHNQHIDGLSSTIISPSRAYAFINNPYVENNDPVIAAVYIRDPQKDLKPIAYTAAFPDMIQEEKKWWFSTLWCHSNYRGKGYPLVAVGSLAEEYGEGNYLDMWGAPETVEIFNYLGLKSSYFTEFHFGPKLQQNNWKGKAAFQLYRIKNLIPYSKLNRTFANYDYSLEYTQFISDETYSFIQRNSSDYILTRTQAMLNWILTYPFMRSMPSTKRVHHNNIFSDKVENYWLSGVTVKKGEQIIGFYILRVRQTELSVKYLYYDGAYQNEVFNSILEHIINQNVTNFSTRNPVLADYTSRLNIFNKRNEIDISFSHPQQLNAEDGKMIQGGDGDSFV